jgi:phosphopantothenoylcysteine decarboxylase/phosphopantothenate--cysteine ligase
LASPLPDLAGVKVVVTAGRTEEPIDPVRCVTSRASGRMGVEVARAFAAAGAEVTLIAGPASVPLPGDVHLTSVRTCAEMRTAVLKEMHRAAALVMCAAVSDYAPAQPARSKLHSTLLNLRLLRTANILEQVAAAPHDAVVVGFSLDDSLGSARAKLERYHLDLVVANPIDTPGSDRVRPTLFYRRGRPVTVPSMTKGRFARTLVARVAELCKTRRIRGPDS